MASSFFKEKRLSCKTYTLFGTWFWCLQIVCSISKCPKIQQDKNLSKFDKSDARTTETWKYMISCKSWKRWSVSGYTDRLSANQIAGKPVRTSCHLIRGKTLCLNSFISRLVLKNPGTTGLIVQQPARIVNSSISHTNVLYMLMKENFSWELSGMVLTPVRL